MSIYCVSMKRCWGLREHTCDDSIVGSFNNRTVKLDDVSVAEDAEDFSLSSECTRTFSVRVESGHIEKKDNCPGFNCQQTLKAKWNGYLRSVRPS